MVFEYSGSYAAARVQGVTHWDRLGGKGLLDPRLRQCGVVGKVHRQRGAERSLCRGGLSAWREPQGGSGGHRAARLAPPQEGGSPEGRPDPSGFLHPFVNKACNRCTPFLSDAFSSLPPHPPLLSGPSFPRLTVIVGRGECAGLGAGEAMSSGSPAPCQPSDSRSPLPNFFRLTAA